MVGQTDPRFSSARFGPWANGPISDPNADPIGGDTVKPGNTLTQSNWLPTPPTNGSESLLYGGAGLDGGGGWSGASGGAGFSAATMAYDEGGVIPSPDGESNGTQDQSGTVDPFAMIQKAVQDFRQKIGGQPRVFYPDGSGGEEGAQSFAEGGSVEASPDSGQEDQQGVVGPGPKPIDPRETVKYLAGDGALQPAVALALEKMTDPGQQMDPAQRLMQTAQMLAQKSPDAAGAYLQAKRVLFNGQMGAASAALKKGNMPLAAHHATQAFSNVPSGHSVRFAPHPHGLVMAATPHGGGQSSGGATEQQEPEPETGASQVDDDGQEQVQSAASGGVIESDETNPSALYQQQQPGSSASYDEGGDVDDEGGDVTGAVTPPSTDDRSLDQIAVDRPQPQILSPDQASAVVNHEAYDRVVDKGWNQYIREFLGGSAATEKPQPQEGPSFVDRLKGMFGGGAQAQQPQTPQQPYQSTQTNVPRERNPLSLSQEDTPQRQERIKAMDQTIDENKQQKKQKQQGDDEEAHVTKREEMLDRLAMKRFPWASESAQREAYKDHLRTHLYGNEKLVNQAQARGEAAMGALRERGAQGMDKEVYRQGEMNSRSNHSAATRVAIEQLRQTGKQRTLTQHDFMVAATKIKGDNPGMSIDDAIKEARTLASASGSGQQQQGGGAQTRKIVVYPTGPYAGKPVYQNPDGTVTPVGQ